VPDYESTDLAGAAHLAREEDDEFPARPPSSDEYRDLGPLSTYQRQALDRVRREKGYL
jgi:hypothetical protein